jgi:outer membrane lipoprotein-sorting protein
MRKNPSSLLFLAAILLSSSLTGCLFRNRTPERRYYSGPLKEATLDDLVTQIGAEAEKIRTLNATVDIATSLGGEKKGKVTDLTEIRGYILVRKPDMLRMIGLFPVVRNRAFDMVSDAQGFKLSIPVKNKFITGPNEAPAKPSSNTLENLRPEIFFDALLLDQIHPNEHPVLEQGTEEVNDVKSKKPMDIPNYVVQVVKQDGDKWILERKIFFSRLDLKPRRQLVYDKKGQVATEAIYENFADYQGVTFPSQIIINRPQEEYSIQLSMVKLTLNQPINDDQFVLKQPDGSQLQVLK